MVGALLVLLLHVHGYRLILSGPRGELLGVTDTGARTVTLYRQPGEPRALLLKALGYETAHVLDVSCLTDGQRREWRRLRHVHGPWWAPDLAPEQGYGSGDFADVYSAWAIHSRAYGHHLPAPRDMRSLATRFHFARGVCP